MNFLKKFFNKNKENKKLENLETKSKKEEILESKNDTKQKVNSAIEKDFENNEFDNYKKKIETIKEKAFKEIDEIESIILIDFWILKGRKGFEKIVLRFSLDRLENILKNYQFSINIERYKFEKNQKEIHNFLDEILKEIQEKWEIEKQKFLKRKEELEKS